MNLKTLETVCGVIIDLKKYPKTKTDGSIANGIKDLIKILYDNNFIPNYLQNDYNVYCKMLIENSGTMRNKNSGHGRGTNNRVVSYNMASYYLNITSSHILYLINEGGFLKK